MKKGKSIEEEEFLKESYKREEIKSYKKIVKIKIILNIILYFVIVLGLLYILLPYENIQEKLIFVYIGMGIIIFAFILESIFKHKMRNKLMKSIYEINLEEFRKEYEEVEIDDEEEKYYVKPEFGIILDYRDYAIKNSEFREEYTEIDRITKLKNRNREMYFSCHIDPTTFTSEIGNYKNSYRKYVFDVFLKTDIASRLSIATKEDLYKESFKDSFIDAEKYALKYDEENFEDVREDFLSEEFYMENFKEPKEKQYLKLDDIEKKTLYDIYQKYKIEFSIYIKDHLLVLETKSRVQNLNESIKYASDINKAFKEILNLFYSIERIERNKNRG